jgi:hypothetical protein
MWGKRQWLPQWVVEKMVVGKKPWRRTAGQSNMAGKNEDINEEIHEKQDSAADLPAPCRPVCSS